MARIFDVAISIILILLFSPLFLCIIIVLRFTGEGEVFYLQERIGMGEELFHVYKFTTMLKKSELMEGGGITRRDDFRVLPVGKVLRKTKLNELPQLFNVFLGTMSFIGPRPLVLDQYAIYSAYQREKISQLKPGLSGIGSIVFRDEEKIMHDSGMDYKEAHDSLITPFKGELECWYFDNQSVFLYFKILLLTGVTVVFPKLKVIHLFKDLPSPKGMLARFL